MGECVEFEGNVYGLVAPLYEQARVLGLKLAGECEDCFVHAETSTKLKVTGVDLFSAGDFADGDGREEIVYRDAQRGVYKRLVLENDKLIGAVLYGETSDGAWFFQKIKDAEEITPDMRETLIFGQNFAGGAPWTLWRPLQPCRMMQKSVAVTASPKQKSFLRSKKRN